MPADWDNVQITLEMRRIWSVKSDTQRINQDELLFADYAEAHGMVLEALKRVHEDLHQKLREENKQINPIGLSMIVVNWPHHDRHHMEQPFDFERAVNRVLVLTHWAHLDGLATVYLERIKGRTSEYAERVLAETLGDAEHVRINPSYVEKLIRKRSNLVIQSL
ncbi:hypothetical protein [Pedosphaera parvula]|uniref:Uncharacterized protein n=1 Tax=Pedosphaera parvula (strain Ellin514) TaxID=320771 RepID=B9X9Y4_PEDPL|nr:hypothetical protein [Pedosphaera parvula]EEF63325.1 hypothetical protein Cflav_PD5960 [Pedosphaera parvula Ellin514]